MPHHLHVCHQVTLMSPLNQGIKCVLMGETPDKVSNHNNNKKFYSELLVGFICGEDKQI